MDYAIAFAETGHLCLATLHANSTNQALDRIINFFPEERRAQLLMDLSLNVRAFVAQRLIPRRDGKGRVPAVEIMLNSPLVSDLIFKGDVGGIKDIMKKSRELGMQTFDQSLFDLYEAGLITLRGRAAQRRFAERPAPRDQAATARKRRTATCSRASATSTSFPRRTRRRPDGVQWSRLRRESRCSG